MRAPRGSSSVSLSASSTHVSRRPKEEACRKRLRDGGDGAEPECACARARGAVLARHRITRGVLREVYEQVCLGYELESMVRQTAEVRQTEWHNQLQVSLNEATTAQLGLESKIVALAAASNAPPDIGDSGSGPVDVVGLVAGLDRGA